MTDELKKAIDNANTEEEQKAVAEKYKDELQQLSDEELEGVAGGLALFFRSETEDKLAARFGVVRKGRQFRAVLE